MSGPQVTPGRRRNKDGGYIQFNDKPKDVGTRTGKTMPTDVPLNADGFEDPSAFFYSPGTEIGMSTIRTTRSAFTALSAPGTGRRALSTPGLGTPAPIGLGKGGMMSRLSGMESDEEDGSGLGEGLLNDGDNILPDHLSSPNPYFSHRSPPKVRQRPAANLGSTSPSIRSPSQSTRKSPRKSRIGVNVNPSPIRSEIHNLTIGDTGDMSTDLADLDDDMDIDEGLVNDAINPTSSPVQGLATTPGQRGSKQDKQNASARKKRKSPEEEDEPEESRDEQSRLSLARAKSRERVRDPDDDSDGADRYGGGEPSFAEPLGMGNDEQFDDSIGETSYAGQHGYGDDDGGEDQNGDGDEDDVDLEQAAIDRENGADSEEEEEEQQHVRTAKKKVAPRPKPTNRSRERSGQPSARPLTEKKRTRVSRIGVEEDDNGWKGDFTTRSGRKHFKPLNWWAGEKFNYGRGQGLAVIKEVVHLPESPPRPLSKKGTRSARSQSAKPGRAGSSSVKIDHEEEGWDDKTEPVGLVNDFNTNKDIQRRIAYTRKHLDPKTVEGSSFKYQKVFGEDQFIASGVVYIPKDSMKPSKPSKDNSYVFYVITGAVQVTIHKTSFVMAPGGTFMVPRGNFYKIENISPYNEAQLFFAQARKIRMDEQETETYVNMLAKQRARSSSAAPTPRHGQESEDDEEEEEEVEEDAPTPRQKARSKVRA